MQKRDLPSLFQVTEVELVYHNKVPRKDRPLISSSADAFEILYNNWDFNKIELLEQFKIMLLDQGSRCLGISEISNGGISACIVDPRIVFSTALKAKASSMILAHNHPSGNLALSSADIQLTEKLAQGGKLLEIKVQDHLILSVCDYYSMSDNGLMP